MASEEGNAAAEAGPDLSLLNQMVGMKKGLALMAEKGVLPTREMVLVLMEVEKEVYASDGGFAKKDQALGKIIQGFEQGAISVKDLFRAVGLDPAAIRPSGGGFSLKRLWARVRPR
jgi:hypothetical protein